MWPKLLDMTRTECKRTLRNLELEAYSAAVTAFRAQGDLNSDRKEILKELQIILSISAERHRAEIRRAVNDEKLTTIATEQQSYEGGRSEGCTEDVSTNWQLEGRRLVPLMPRLVPQTAFTVTADLAANQQSDRNACLPPATNTAYTKPPVISPPPALVPQPEVSSTFLQSPDAVHSNIVIPQPQLTHPSGHPGLSLGQANVPIAEANIIVSHSAHMVHHQANEQLQHSYSHVATHTSTSPGRVPLTQQLSPRAATITSPTPPMPLQNAPQMQSPKITSPPHITDPGLRSPPGLTNMPLGSPPAGVSLVHPAHRNDQRMEKALQYKPPQVHHSPIKKTPLIGGPQIATTTHAVGSHQKVILVSGNSGTPGVAAQRKSIVKPAEQPSGTLNRSMSHPGTSMITSTVYNPSTGSTSVLSSTPIRAQHPKKTLMVQHQPRMAATGVTRTVLGPHPRYSYQAMTGTPRPQRVSGPPLPQRVTGPPTVQRVPGPPPPRAVGPAPIQRPPASITPQRTVAVHASQPAAMASAQSQGAPINPNQARKFVGTSNPSSGPSGSNIVVLNPNQGAQGVNKSGVQTRYVNFPSATKVVGGATNVVTVTPKTLQTIQGGPGKANVIVVQKAPVGSESSIRQPYVLTKASVGGAPGESPTKRFQVTPQKKIHVVQQRPIMPRTPVGRPAKQVLRVASNVPQTPGTSTMESNQSRTPILKDLMHAGKSEHLPVATSLGQSYQTIVMTGGPPNKSTATVIASGQTGVVQQQASSTILTVNNANSGLKFVSGAQNVVHQQNVGHITVPITTQRAIIPKTSTSNVTRIVTAAQMVKVPEKSQAPPQVAENTGVVKVVSANTPVDFLSSALTQADVNLDPSYYLDDATGLPASLEKATAAPKQMSSILQTVSTSICETQQRVSSVQSDSTNKKYTIPSNLKTSGQAGVSLVTAEPDIQSGTTNETQSNMTSDMQPSMSGDLDFSESLVSSEQYGDNVVAVAVEQVSMDPTQMNIAELTSQVSDQEKTIMSTDGFIGLDDQPIMEESIVSTDDITVDSEEVGDGSSMALTPTRLSKRKRRPPQALVDDSPPAIGIVNQASSWMKDALTLLSTVTRFKGETNLTAAVSDWFMHPVDPNEAPDYYEIIKNPMDFTTIRRKLEMSQYQDWDDFNADMYLIRDNCYAYNPPGHLVRHDCDQVFSFYRSIYDQTVQNWEHQQTVNKSPSVAKKARQDKSPRH